MTNNALTQKKWFHLVLKLVLFQALYVIFHYFYSWFPGGATLLFSCAVESPFEHLKMAFFAYIVVSVVEYIVLRKSSQRSSL